jgi:S1-C subfamily serine protease
MRTIMVLEPSYKSLLLSLRFNGTEIATGTGFIVKSRNKPVLITNRHNVTGKDNITGKHLSKTAAEPNEIGIWHNLKDNLGRNPSQIFG